jgi:mannonate dehydratase
MSQARSFWGKDPARPPMKWRIRHSMQLADLSDEQLQLAKQIGMEYVNVWPTPPADFKAIVARVEAAGLKVAKIGNRSVHNRAEITLNLPGRDAKVEQFKQNLRNLAAAGISYQTYAHMATGVTSSERGTGRGGASCRTFEVGQRSEKESYSYQTFTFDRLYTEQELWDNYEYFIKRVAPVAEETGVRIGIHPDDPPGLTLGNVPRPIFSSLEGYRRALEIADSPNVGICLCCGTWMEGGEAMGCNVLEAIEHFARMKKLFCIHFRNIDRPLPRFHETFLNEGFMDMYAIMRLLRQHDFEGVLIADHWPFPVGGSTAGQIYTVGYIQALIERANEEFL